MTPGTIPTDSQRDRQTWMSVLAHASWPRLEALWAGEDVPGYIYLRKPETGLVMLRARIGGTGDPFNVGEASVTRCSVKIAGGNSGHAYIMGRASEHALTAALCDAQLQDPSHHARIMDRIIHSLAAERTEALLIEKLKTAATKVDFFTLVRGDD
ncbi:phosphonate C-P lyase system protein PhnG [soil metagenome]